ncbi:hypothetical protein Tco_0813754 [Tanacetum coccineum]
MEGCVVGLGCLGGVLELGGCRLGVWRLVLGMVMGVFDLSWAGVVCLEVGFGGWLVVVVLVGGVGSTIPTTPSSLPKVVEHETEVTKDTVPPTNKGSTKDVQPSVVQVETHVPIFEPVVAPVSASKPNPKPSIPYPSRLNDQKIREKANNQIEKFYQIFQDLRFDISFADALTLMPNFASTLKSLISNKEKLFELARTPLNEHCLAVLLKRLPKKLEDPSKFLIPCDFPGMDECLAMADLGASINLMPFGAHSYLYDS